LSKVALVTGVTGQDGSYLVELLLDKGYEVHGIYRRSSSCPFNRIAHLKERVRLHCADLLDQSSLASVLDIVRPTEVYNLAAQSFVGTSWHQPIQTTEVTGTGVLRLLEAIRVVDKSIRFYQASSSEMFGKVHETPQRESTRFHPRSPYGVAKVFGHWATVNYRESYDMYCCSGILFNHESPRRGIEFVTRKITNGVARIAHGLDRELRLGNLAAKRDWGFAGDYVRAMWMMLQQEEPTDFVVGTGELHSVQEFVEIAFEHVGLDWREHVVIDPKFFRPAEVDLLQADPSFANDELGWRPEMSFENLVKSMVDTDLAEFEQAASQGLDRLKVAA
jgi:GDPmannose 4,6-dehydratase